MGDITNLYTMLVRKPGWKTPLGMPRYTQDVKVRLTLQFIKHQATKEYREVKVQVHAFLTLALCHFMSEEPSPVSIGYETQMLQN